jgi:hypothetical protein
MAAHAAAVAARMRAWVSERFGLAPAAAASPPPPPSQQRGNGTAGLTAFEGRGFDSAAAANNVTSGGPHWRRQRQRALLGEDGDAAAATSIGGDYQQPQPQPQQPQQQSQQQRRRRAAADFPALYVVNTHLVCGVWGAASSNIACRTPCCLRVVLRAFAL